MTWTAVASLPEALADPAVGATGGKLYAWGLNGAFTTLKGYAYDPGTDTWTAVANCPAGSPASWTGGFLVALGSYLYLITLAGASGTFGADFLRYDPTGNTWTDLTTTSSIDPNRLSVGADAVGTKLAWVSTGSTGGPPAVTLYDPGTNTWGTRGIDCPTIDFGLGCTVATVGSDVYVLAGYGIGAGAPTGKVAAYHPGSNTWTAHTANPGTATYFFANPTAGPLTLIPAIGGFDSGGSTVDVVSLYDPAGDSWSTFTTLPSARSNSGGAVLSSRFYCVGGADSGGAAMTDVIYAPADFSGGGGGGGTVSISGTSARSRTAVAHTLDALRSVAARHRGSTAAVSVVIPLVAPDGIGWEFNGRIRDASATIDIDDPVVPPPAQHGLIKTQWLTITGPPDLDSNGQPDPTSWPSTRHTGTWGRYRIRVAGKDVTWFRGAQTLVVNESDTEPGGDDLFTVTFPMIGPFEALGTGALAWLPGTDDDKHVPVIVEKVNGSGARSVRWEGDVQVLTDTYDGRSGGLQVQFLGLVKTLDERITKPRVTSDPIDAAQLMHQMVAYEVKYGWNGHGLPAVDSGISTAEHGGYGDPLFSVTFQNLLAQMQTGENTQWTLTNRRPRGMKLIVKDRTTVHFTLWCGQPGVTHNLTRNLEHAVRAIFGEGMDAGTQHWRNTQFPNAQINPPAYPLPDDVFFNPGDGHTGFQAFSDELRTRGYRLRSQDTYLAADEDVIRDFQNDTGARVDGVVGGQTWSRAFAIAADAHSLYSYIRPLTVVSAAEPFLYNGRGGIIGKNPGYTGRTRREKLEQYGTLSKADAKKSAKLELPIVATSDFLGTVTAESIDPPEMCALDTRAGMNFLFKGHRGVDRLFHAAKVDRNPGMVPGQARTVTWTASERGDDYVTLASRLLQKRDVVDQSGRTKAPRRTSKHTPDFAPWESESGGYLSPRAQTARLWNVYPIPAGERGTMVHVRLVASTPCLISAAVFNKPISPETLTNLPGLAEPDSGAAGGQDPWQVNATYLAQTLTYADQPLMAWATGGPGSMQGYWPNIPDVGATVTGVLDDSMTWPFHSTHGQWLWLAVWTSATCRIGGDPAYDHRALWPGPDA